eukprot:m.271277 g.271277  ORF g.271277 m.271277 type:complete len:445 (-) comp94286_c0_seq1:257-1591(-)
MMTFTSSVIALLIAGTATSLSPASKKSFVSSKTSIRNSIIKEYIVLTFDFGTTTPLRRAYNNSTIVRASDDAVRQRGRRTHDEDIDEIKTEMERELVEFTTLDVGTFGVVKVCFDMICHPVRGIQDVCFENLCETEGSSIMHAAATNPPTTAPASPQRRNQRRAKGSPSVAITLSPTFPPSFINQQRKLPKGTSAAPTSAEQDRLFDVFIPSPPSSSSHNDRPVMDVIVRLAPQIDEGRLVNDLEKAGDNFVATLQSKDGAINTRLSTMRTFEHTVLLTSPKTQTKTNKTAKKTTKKSKKKKYVGKLKQKTKKSKKKPKPTKKPTSLNLRSKNKNKTIKKLKSKDKTGKSKATKANANTGDAPPASTTGALNPVAVTVITVGAIVSVLIVVGIVHVYGKTCRGYTIKNHIHHMESSDGLTVTEDIDDYHLYLRDDDNRMTSHTA